MREAGKDGKILAGQLASVLFIVAGTALFRTGQDWPTLGPIKGTIALGICAWLLWLGAEHAAPLFPRAKAEQVRLAGKMRWFGGLVIALLGIEYLFTWKGATGDWLFWVQVGLGVFLLVAPSLAGRAASR